MSGFAALVLIVALLVAGWAWVFGRQSKADPRPCSEAGHSYEARHDKEPVTLDLMAKLRNEATEVATIKFDPHGKMRSVDAEKFHWWLEKLMRMATRHTYVHDVCARCGHVVNREAEVREALEQKRAKEAAEIRELLKVQELLKEIEE